MRIEFLQIVKEKKKEICFFFKIWNVFKLHFVKIFSKSQSIMKTFFNQEISHQDVSPPQT